MFGAPPAKPARLTESWLTGETMDRDDVWRAIDDQRRRLIEVLEDPSEQEWQHPSSCRGWTVRQVAAQVALQHITWPMMPPAVLDMVRPGGAGALQARLPSVRS